LVYQPAHFSLTRCIREQARSHIWSEYIR